MQLSQSLSNNPDFRRSKSKSKNKMVKSRNTHSQKSSLKNIDPSKIHNIQSELSYQPKTANMIIKQKYFDPALIQYNRSDANMITRCAKKDFQYDSDGRAMELYEFVQFFNEKETLKKYQTGVVSNLKEIFDKIAPVSQCNNSVNRHIFHFYENSYYILRNRMMKLKNLQSHQSVLRSEKGSSIKNSDRKKGLKSKSKQKNMDNLLKGIFSTKNTQKSRIVQKIKKVKKNPQPRQTHIISNDSQDMNQLLTQLNALLKAHSIQSYSQISTQQQIALPLQSNEFPATISGISCFSGQKSKVKEMKQKAKNNEFTEIMQSQYSHISAIKSSQINNNMDQYEFYGLSSIRDKKMKKQQKNASKNDSYFPQVQSSANQSRLTNKRVSTQFQVSNIFSEQTPKKIQTAPTNPLKHLQRQQFEMKKPKSRSRTLRKGNNDKSKSKSLSSTQRSLKKDQLTQQGSVGGFVFKNTKLSSGGLSSKSTKNISKRLLFMEPANQKQTRKPHLMIGNIKSDEQRKQSKSRSKGKLLLMKKS